MERITMSLDAKLAAEFDALVERRGYANRSEAMRDLLRREIEAERPRYETRGWCVATLAYVYRRDMRSLDVRLAALQHDHHDLVIAASHVPLDHEQRLETLILKGSTARVRAFADRVRAERGVRHAALHVIAVEPDDAHALPGAHRHHGHLHLNPRS